MVALIPLGRVVTYGEVAQLAGFPNQARQVGRILSQLPRDSQLPWHRVINAQGRLSFPPDSNAYQRQRDRLEAEGVEFSRGRISLQRFGLASLELRSVE